MIILCFCCHCFVTTNYNFHLILGYCLPYDTCTCIRQWCSFNIFKVGFGWIFEVTFSSSGHVSFCHLMASFSFSCWSISPLTFYLKAISYIFLWNCLTNFNELYRPRNILYILCWNITDPSKYSASRVEVHRTISPETISYNWTKLYRNDVWRYLI